MRSLPAVARVPVRSGGEGRGDGRVVPKRCGGGQQQSREPLVGRVTAVGLLPLRLKFGERGMFCQFYSSR